MKSLKTIFFILVISIIISPLKAQDSALIKPVNALIDNYLALKNALVIGNGDLAAAKGKLLLASVNEVPKAGLRSEEVALLAKLEYDSRHISEVPHVAHQREHFANLSNNLYTFLKDLKVNKITLYRQYCVMNKQFFLSESAGGKDPYMGMANCSKVKGTLPAVK
jgi:hypothetical protein